MTSGAVDVVGFLPAPGTARNRGAADLLEGQLFAYGAGSGITVVEVHRLHVACVLQGGHKNAAVTALKWCPDCHSRDLKQNNQLRLASGDSDGGIVVWSVMSMTATARHEELPSRKGVSGADVPGTGNSGSAPGNAGLSTSSSAAAAGPSSGGVQDLAWVFSNPSLLAVLLAPATLLLFDARGSVVVWRHKLSNIGELFTGMSADPLDRRRLVLTSSAGALAVVQLAAPGEVERMDVQQYRVNLPAPGEGRELGRRNPERDTGSPATFQAAFAATRDLLFVLLPREIVVFDLELGVPAASKSLPAGRSAFASLLGVFGRGVSHGIGDEGGVDCIYCTHLDGSLSIWSRSPGELQYGLSLMTRLTPPAQRGGTPPLTLLAARADIWKHDVQAEELQARPSLLKVDETTRRLAASLLHGSAPKPTKGADAAANASAALAAASVPSHSEQASCGGPPSPSQPPVPSMSDKSLLIIALTSDGKLWQWDAPLPHFSDRALLQSAPGGDTPMLALAGSLQVHASRPLVAAPPLLVGLLHTLPYAVSTFCMYPRAVLASPGRPVLLDSSSHRHGAAPPSLSTDQQGCHSWGLQSPAADRAAGGVETAEVTMLGAAVTANGTLEVFSVHQGLVMPLSVDVGLSLCLHKGVVIRGVRWLGDTNRLATFANERTANGGWRNALLLTDVASRRSTPFRDEPHHVAGEAAQLLGIRASPEGSYLLLIMKGAPAELWAVGSEVPRPVRLRLLDLPCSAVEWVQPQTWLQTPDGDQPMPEFTAWTHSGSATSACRESVCQAPAKTAAGQIEQDAALAHQLAKLPDDARPSGAGRDGGVGRSGAGQAAGGAGADQHRPAAVRVAGLDGSAAVDAAVTGAAAKPQPSAALFPSLRGESAVPPPVSVLTPGHELQVPLPMPPSPISSVQWPEALLAFTLIDRRMGVLSVRGRKVTDTRPKRPLLGVMQPLEVAATAIVAFGKLVVLGDMDGHLSVWDTSTGRSSTLATGLGMVRRMQLAPPPHPALYTPPEGVLPIHARLAVLFTGGHFAVYEMDAKHRLRPGHVSATACARVGRIVDLAWVPLPWCGLLRPCASGGSVLSVVTEDGVLTFLDVAQAADRSPTGQHRHAVLRRLLAAPQASVGLGQALPQPCLLLAPPPPVGSGLLMQRSWVLLLRLVVQLGISQSSLLYLSSPAGSEDEDVRDELLALMPRALHRHLQGMLGVPGGHALQSQLSDDFASVHLNTSLLGRRGSLGGVLQPPTPTLGSAPVREEEHMTQDEARRASSPQASTSPRQPSSTSPVARSSSLMKSLSSVLGGGWNPQLEPSLSLKALPSGRQSMGVSDSHDQHFSEFGGNLLQHLRLIASRRSSNKQLLHPAEWRSYTKALSSGSVAERMVVAAKISGDGAEARFWTALPSTLQAVKELQQEMLARRRHADTARGLLGSGSAPPGSAPGRPMPVVQAAPSQPMLRPTPVHVGGLPVATAPTPPRGTGRAGTSVFSGAGSGLQIKGVASGPLVRLWDEDLTLAEAQERTMWHEAMSRSAGEEQEQLQERRLLEYVVLGDYQTAVAFLLASSPGRSARYYRDAVCTMALASAVASRTSTASAGGSSALGDPRPLPCLGHSTLQLQAAKVISANAASVGDPLLGVPLHCSAGLYAEAVGILQECGLWRYGANLAAHALSGSERAVALQRWAQHVHEKEGSLWRAVGILTAAGVLREALKLLQMAGLPDCAEAYVTSCQHAGLVYAPPLVRTTSRSASFTSQAASSGELQLEAWPEVASAASAAALTMPREPVVPPAGLPGGLQAPGELWDVLVAAEAAAAAGAGGAGSGSGRHGRRLSRMGSGDGLGGDLGVVHAEFEHYIADILQHL